MIPDRWRAQVAEWVAQALAGLPDSPVEDVAIEIRGPVLSADGETTLYEALILMPVGGEPDAVVWAEGFRGAVSGLDDIRSGMLALAKKGGGDE